MLRSDSSGGARSLSNAARNEIEAAKDAKDMAAAAAGANGPAFTQPSSGLQPAAGILDTRRGAYGEALVGNLTTTAAATMKALKQNDDAKQPTGVRQQLEEQQNDAMLDDASSQAVSLAAMATQRKVQGSSSGSGSSSGAAAAAAHRAAHRHDGSQSSEMLDDAAAQSAQLAYLATQQQLRDDCAGTAKADSAPCKAVVAAARTAAARTANASAPVTTPLSSGAAAAVSAAATVRTRTVGSARAKAGMVTSAAEAMDQIVSPIKNEMEQLKGDLAVAARGGGTANLDADTKAMKARTQE